MPDCKFYFENNGNFWLFAEFHGTGFNPMFVVYAFLTTEYTEAQRRISNGISSEVGSLINCDKCFVGTIEIEIGIAIEIERK